MIAFRRAIQLLSLGLFLFLMTLAVCSVNTRVPLDLFLQMDPGLGILTAISARSLGFFLVPALVTMLATFFFGRIFCGYFCPMGTTLDGGYRLICSKKKTRRKRPHFPQVKYVLVFFLLGAALIGVSLVFLTSPLSLVTRFYGLLIHPILAYFVHQVLALLNPLADALGFTTLAFMQTATPRFNTQMFILLFFAVLFATARFSPRFWCRNLCPSGAILAFCARKPLVRRQVSNTCTLCGKCVNACPMAAILPEEPQRTRHDECIVCRTCEAVCPEHAISFGVSRESREALSQIDALDRRQWLFAGFLGAVLAGTGLTGLYAPQRKPGPGQVAPPGFLRPPGSLPEESFLARCVRCGECMAACPTNTLQPIWFETGFTAAFSPVLTPRRGYCSPQCRMCGQVCPTGAIRNLSRGERIWAKTGTAVIYPSRCLAWEQQKSCMVCDEVCPYKAIVFQKETGNPVPVPRVNESRCAGCGYCEHYCPVHNRAAIVVIPMGAFRFAEGSYKAQGEAEGLTLSIHQKSSENGRYHHRKEQLEFAPGFDMGPAEKTKSFRGFDDS
jgi:ferredoxin